MDDLSNFAFSQVGIAPSPASSGATLTVALGEGVNFPNPPFNVTVWPEGVQALKENSEIVRVIGRSGDVFTITREQEGTTARSILMGDRIAATITKKMIQDIIDELGAPHVEQIFMKNQTTGLYDSLVLVGVGDDRQLVFG